MSDASARIHDPGETSQAPAANPSRRRSLGGWLLRLAIGLGILAYLFSLVPISEALDALASSRLEWIVLAVAALAIERFAAAVRITILSDQTGMSLSVWQNLKISMAATFYGMFLPGELAGGAVRWYKMSRPNGMRAQAAAALTFDRLTSTIMLLLTGIGFWLLEDPPMSNSTLELAFLVLLAALAVGVAISLSPRATSILLSAVSLSAQRMRISFVSEKLEKVLDSVQSFRELSGRRITTLLGVMLFRELVAVGLIFFLAASLGMGVTFLTIGWVRAFTNIAMMLPITVSGLGVREGTLMFALQPYGIDGSLALALSFLVLLTHILVAGAGGVFELKDWLATSRTRATGSTEAAPHNRPAPEV